MSSERKIKSLTRRQILHGMAFAPMAFRAAPIFAGPLLSSFPSLRIDRQSGIQFADLLSTQGNRSKSPLADITALVTPGSDGYASEKYADEISLVVEKWGDALKLSPSGLVALAVSLDESIEA